MSWMDDGGFEIKTFAKKRGDDGPNEPPHLDRPIRLQPHQDRGAAHPPRMQSNPQGTGGRQMTSHGSNHEVRKPNYTLRRIKTLLAIIACTASATLLFTWRTADSQTATVLVSVIYILTGLWLTVRFAPRD
nr:MAG TPA: hypothetical protein [Caudoviricetes sp.]